MNAIDRVMRAYSKTHELTDAQYQQVRIELSAFIRELAFGKPLAADGTKQVPRPILGRRIEAAIGPPDSV